MKEMEEKTFLLSSSTKPPSSPSSSSSTTTKVSVESGDTISSRSVFSYMSTASSYVYCIFVLLALAGIVLTVIDHKVQIHQEMKSNEGDPFRDRGSLLVYRDREKNRHSSGGDTVSRSDKENEIRRKLSLKIDPITGDSLRTYNGDVPETQCPAGKYRLPGSTDLQMIRGQRTDGCVYCPRGRYGETTRLDSRQCTAPCPTGRYGDRLGATSVKECRFCPTGKFGATQALTSSKCSGKCPAGKYSGTVGLTRSSECKDCPVGYRGWQCASWDNIPLKDSQLNRLNSGQVVSNPDRILE